MEIVSWFICVYARANEKKFVVELEIKQYFFYVISKLHKSFLKRF